MQNGAGFLEGEGESTENMNMNEYSLCNRQEAEAPILNVCSEEIFYSENK